MPYRLSKIYNIAQSTWDETTAFDFFVGLDAPLYIVLSLLNDTSAEELKDAKAIFDDHFSAILHLLRSAQSIRDPFLQEQQKNVHSRKSQILALVTLSMEGKAVELALAWRQRSLALENKYSMQELTIVTYSLYWLFCRVVSAQTE